MTKSRYSGGYSLIELMVAMAIGLLILVMLLGLVVSSSSNSKSNQGTSDLQTTGRYAVDLLKRELRDAGARGFTQAQPNTPTTTITTPAITLECLESGATAGSFVSNISQGIWGADNSNPFSANCIPSANYLAGDILVIRKTSPSPEPNPEALSTGAFYFRSNYTAGEIFHGSQATACGASTPANAYAAPFNKQPCVTGSPYTDLRDYAVREYVYYVSPYTNSASESPKIPALWRVALQQSGQSSPGNFAAELVASGVEQMEVQYMRNDGTYTWLDAGKSTGKVSLNGKSTDVISDWNNANGSSGVTAVRFWLLVRAPNFEPGYVNTTTYTMGNATKTVNDGFRRQLFYTVVNLRV